MTSWYYTRAGQQAGPVTQDALRQLIARGEVNPVTDLVWTQGMADWLPAEKVAALAPAASTPPPHNPYAPPASDWTVAETRPTSDLTEIEPGSEPLEIGACLRRAFELTKRHFGLILLTGMIYFAINFMIEMVFGVAEGVLTSATRSGEGTAGQHTLLIVNIVHQIFSHVASTFLSLGAARIGLNLVSGQAANVGMLFGEGRKLWSAVGAGILYILMVFVGMLLLVVPGVYLALRFGQYLNAIVDRDLGAIDALKYSSRITHGNRVNLLGLGIVAFGIVLAGLLALVVGLIFAMPLAWLLGFVAYRWLQYGQRSTTDPV